MNDTQKNTEKFSPSSENIVKMSKKAATVSAMLISMVLTVVAYFWPIMSVVLIAIAAGYTAAGICADKKMYPLLSILPAAILAIAHSRNYLFCLLLLIVPVCALIICACACKGAKKALTVIVSSIAFGLIIALAFLFVFYMSYGSFSVDAFEQLKSDVSTGWSSSVESSLELIKEQQEKTYQQYSSLGVGNNSDEYMKELNDSIDSMRILLLDEVPLMLGYLCPAIIIAIFNALSYVAVTVCFRLISKEKIYTVNISKEQTKLDIEAIGMIIFTLSYILSVVVGGYETVAGAVFMNLFLIYMPAMAVIGLRILFREGGIKQNMFYVIMMGICLFINPVLAVLLLGFFAAGHSLNNKLINYLQKKKDDMERK